jgi:diguanylate cyclase (GGDEF)-like protein
MGAAAASLTLAWTLGGPVLAAHAGLPRSLAARAGEWSTILTAAGLVALCSFGPWLRRPAGGSRGAEIASLELAARSDSLTGLRNHRSFHHDLSLAIQRRATTGTAFTLLAIDLDGLKQINDANGHQAGDAYIRCVAEALLETTGSQGTVYRTGGDEFAVLLPGSRNWHGLALAQKLGETTRAAVGRRAVSIGLAESTGTESRQAIVHQADLALYEAKRTKLSAVSYHPGLAPAETTVSTGPSHHQKTLAAALARAVDAKDVCARSHSETVAELCVGIGRRLGIAGPRLERLRLAGLLHDVGKIGVPDAILQKTGSLAADELDEIRRHVRIGHGILTSAELSLEAEWVLYHHERCDGAGYPSGLGRDEIPLESRIIAVADAFEAMTSDRAYRARATTGEALDELRRNAGTQFDEGCVAALVDVVGEVAPALAPPAQAAA